MPRIPDKIKRLADGGLAWGATNSGKSFGLGYVKVRDYAKNPGRHLLVGPDRNTLVTEIIPNYRRIAAHYRVPVGKFNHLRGTITIGKSTLYVKAGAKKGDEENLRGRHNYLSLVAEEVAKMLPDYIDMAIDRTAVGAPFHASCNPDVPTNWVKKRLDEGWWRHDEKFLVSDNPSLTKQQVEEYIARHDPTTTYYKRMILGEWFAEDGLVYPHWQECNCTFDPRKPYLLAYDPAPVNTQAALCIQMQEGIDPHFCVVDEHYTRRGATLRSARAACEQIEAKWGRPLLASLDTAAYDHIFEATYALRWTVVTPATREHLVTIPQLNLLLGQGRLRINPATCKNTVSELYSVIYDDKRETIRTGQEDHATDALRHIAGRLQAFIPDRSLLHKPTVSDAWDNAYVNRDYSPLSLPAFSTN